MDDMFDQPRPTNHARLVCLVPGTGLFTAIAALMELSNTRNAKHACQIFALGNTAALFIGPQTAERVRKGHCTKKHIILGGARSTTKPQLILLLWPYV